MDILLSLLLLSVLLSLLLFLQAAGFLWQHNFLKIQSWVVIPEFVSRTFDSLTGWLLHSPRPANLDAPMGATLELQRQERLEKMEEQMVAAALRNAAVGRNRAGAADMLRPQPLVSGEFG